MGNFIIGFITCYLLLTFVAMSNVQSRGHFGAPWWEKLHSVGLIFVTILPVLVFVLARNVAFRLEEGPLDDDE